MYIRIFPFSHCSFLLLKFPIPDAKLTDPLFPKGRGKKKKQDDWDEGQMGNMGLSLNCCVCM